MTFHINRGVVFALAVFLVGSQPATARAGEAYHLLMFGSQRIPNNPDYSHTFAVFVRSTWEGNCPCPRNPTLEYHTISWLPVTGVVQTMAREPEPGRNYGLHETLRLALKNEERVSLWGPYPIRKDLYCRGLKRIAELESGRLQYKANDTRYDLTQVSNCIHAVSGVVDGNRVRGGSPGWGDIASYTVLLRMRPWVLRGTPEHFIALALGLAEYPLVYRSEFNGPWTGPFAGVLANLLSPSRNLVPTYGPPR